MKVLGIIPARGGSKNIPRKNLATVCGKSLLAYAVESALASTLLSDVVVSTEDDEIASAALRLGATVAHRPAELAMDHTPTIAVLLHHLLDYDHDAICCLQPTCPLRTADDIDEAIRTMERTNCDSVVSYVDAGAHHPARMAFITTDGKVSGGPWAAYKYVRSVDGTVTPVDTFRWSARQDLPTCYLRSGDVYLTKRDVLKRGSLVGRNERAILIPRERWCNVDAPIDLVVAEALVRLNQSPKEEFTTINEARRMHGLPPLADAPDCMVPLVDALAKSYFDRFSGGITGSGCKPPETGIFSPPHIVEAST